MTAKATPGDAAMSPGITIVVLGPSGLKTASRLKQALDHAEIHGAATRLAETDVDLTYDDLGTQLRQL
ncbi:MAG: hypothetical protein ACR2RE_25710, partial [Geminicoccaceae bacterium]